MRKIEHALIIAGPTACGKLTLIRHVAAGGAPDLQGAIGIERPQEWTWMRTGTMLRRPDAELERVILHHDFLWSYPGANLNSADRQEALSSILETTREVSIVTLWTPPARLARHLIDGKLRIPLQSNRVQRLKASIFRCLPRPAILGLSKIRWWNPIDRWLPGHAFIQYLRVLELCSRPDEVVAQYRRWFEYCDRHLAKTRAHVIVESDTELKFYSRDEWQRQVQAYEGG